MPSFDFWLRNISDKNRTIGNKTLTPNELLPIDSSFYSKYKSTIESLKEDNKIKELSPKNYKQEQRLMDEYEGKISPAKGKEVGLKTKEIKEKESIENRIVELQNKFKLSDEDLKELTEIVKKEEKKKTPSLAKYDLTNKIKNQILTKLKMIDKDTLEGFGLLSYLAKNPIEAAKHRSQKLSGVGKYVAENLEKLNIITEDQVKKLITVSNKLHSGLAPEDSKILSQIKSYIDKAREDRKETEAAVMKEFNAVFKAPGKTRISDEKLKRLQELSMKGQFVPGPMETADDLKQKLNSLVNKVIEQGKMATDADLKQIERITGYVKSKEIKKLGPREEHFGFKQKYTKKIDTIKDAINRGLIEVSKEDIQRLDDLLDLIPKLDYGFEEDSEEEKIKNDISFIDDLYKKVEAIKPTYETLEEKESNYLDKSLALIERYKDINPKKFDRLKEFISKLYKAVLTPKYEKVYQRGDKKEPSGVVIVRKDSFSKDKFEAVLAEYKKDFEIFTEFLEKMVADYGNAFEKSDSYFRIASAIYKFLTSSIREYAEKLYKGEKYDPIARKFEKEKIFDKLRSIKEMENSFLGGDKYTKQIAPLLELFSKMTKKEFIETVTDKHIQFINDIYANISKEVSEKTKEMEVAPHIKKQIEKEFKEKKPIKYKMTPESEMYRLTTPEKQVESNFRHMLSLFKTYDFIDNFRKFADAINKISPIKPILKDPYKKLPGELKKKKRMPEKSFEDILKEEEERIVDITAQLAIGDITERYYRTMNDAKYALQIAKASNDIRNLQIQKDPTGQFIIREIAKAAKIKKMEKRMNKEAEINASVEALDNLRLFLDLSEDPKKISEGIPLLKKIKDSLGKAGYKVEKFDNVINAYKKGKSVSELIGKMALGLAEKIEGTTMEKEEAEFYTETGPAISEEEESSGREQYQEELEAYREEEGLGEEAFAALFPRRMIRRTKQKVLRRRARN